MTALTPVSYAELLRAGIHALRGLGFSFSVAERAVHSLAGVEAATGLGLSFLRVAHERITHSVSSVATLADLADGVVRMDARGKSLFEVAPFALDVVSADARRFGSAALLVEDCFGMAFVADVAARARGQHEAVLALYRERAGEPMRCFGGTGLFHIAGETVQGGPASLSGLAAERALRPILGSARADRFGQQLLDAVVEGDGSVLLVAGDREPIHSRASVAELARDSGGEPWQRSSTWLSAIDRAIKGQIYARDEDFEFFTRCVTSIWVPTSERSRAQQG